jgi:hypothetical protein
MGDERPNRYQPDGRADDRDESQAFASHDGVVPARAMEETIDETMIEVAKSAGRAN